MKFIYPPIKNLSPSPNTKSLTFEEILADSNYSNDLGSFIIGKNKVFHGGINLVVPNGHGLQAVANGHIIAYRVSKEYQKIEHSNKDKSTTLEFSNNFILVEHDFNQFTYMQLVNGTTTQNPYTGYKFYTLYMHMMPLNECTQQKILPDWLVLNKKINPILVRGVELQPKVLSYTQGFTIAQNILNNQTIKISEKDIVNIKGKNYLNKMLDVYDTSSTAIKILDQFFTTDDVVVLDTSTKIAVKAGELLGYAGKSQANSIDQSQGNSTHFEIWLDRIDFLNNNIKNNYASYIIDDPNSTAQRRSVFSNLDIRSLGYSYIEGNNTNLIFESLCFNEDPPLTLVCARIKGSLSARNGTTTDFLNYVLNNQKKILYTDADWLNNPVNPWKLYQQSDFFNSDGSIKEVDFKNKYSNPKVWKKLQNRAIIKLEYSEWDKKDFETKYNFLLSKESQYFSKLDQNTFQTLKKYQDSVSFLDKTATSTLIPKLEKMYVINPIEFLMQIKRCMLPAPPTANTHLVKRLIQYSLDENVYLLKSLLEKMDLWISGKNDQDLDTKFKRWFGYQKGKVAQIIATSVVYSNGITPPNVTDFNVARKVVRERLAHGLKVLENINDEKLCFGWGIEAGAFVYPDDLNHNVHVGFQMFPHSAVDASNQVSTIENFKVPPFRRALSGDVGFVNCLLHEALHFVIENSDVKDPSIVANMYAYNSNYTYLNDIHVDYVDIVGIPVEFHAYGIPECKNLAQYIPSATLANSDSYAEFFADVMESFRPNIQYRCI